MSQKVGNSPISQQNKPRMSVSVHFSLDVSVAIRCWDELSTLRVAINVLDIF